MKKIIACVLSLLVLVPVTVYAGSSMVLKDEFVIVGKEEVVEHDIFVTGERVELSGTVNGDAYVAGADILIDGTVDGDVLVFGGNVRITGEVTQDIRVIGGTVVIGAQVGRNVSAIGGEVEIMESAQVEGSVASAGGVITIAGPVVGNITAGAGQLTISSEISGDVNAAVEELRFTSSAAIEGDVTYHSKEEAAMSDGAVIGGMVTRKTPPIHGASSQSWKEAFLGIAIAGKVLSVFSAVLIGMLMLRFYPHYMARMARTVEKRTWPSVGIGLVTLIVVPILTVMLTVTLIGLPLGLILLAFYAIGIYLAKIFFMVLLGHVLVRHKKANPYVSLLVGGVVYGVLTLIPFVGAVIALFALLTGLGAMMLVEKELYTVAFKKEIV